MFNCATDLGSTVVLNTHYLFIYLFIYLYAADLDCIHYQEWVLVQSREFSNISENVNFVYFVA